jgi:hypothetical protein
MILGPMKRWHMGAEKITEIQGQPWPPGLVNLPVEVSTCN